jgi:hypothetical protein
MKLTTIKDIEILNVEQSLTVKGGARDTRGDQTSSASPIILVVKPK